MLHLAVAAAAAEVKLGGDEVAPGDVLHVTCSWRHESPQRQLLIAFLRNKLHMLYKASSTDPKTCTVHGGTWQANPDDWLLNPEKNPECQDCIVDQTLIIDHNNNLYRESYAGPALKATHQRRMLSNAHVSDATVKLGGDAAAPGDVRRVTCAV